MITNYWICLNALPEKEKTKQILVLLSFFLILLVICGLLELLKSKSIKCSLQKLLKML